MTTTMKKTIIAILTVALLVTMAPLTAFAGSRTQSKVSRIRTSVEKQTVTV